MKKRYRISSGFDMNITLEIDTDLIPEALAHEVNNFWSGAKDVLSASNGDAHQAVARRAAGNLLLTLLDGYTELGAITQLSDQEGWPDLTKGAMTIIDFETPSLDSDDFDVEVLA